MNETWYQKIQRVYGQFKIWREKVKERRKKARYNAGFQMAMKALMNGSQTEYQLYQCTREAQDFGDYTEFDDGVRDAIDRWRTVKAKSLKGT